jgi:large subunit ribosomal protein L15
VIIVVLRAKKNRKYFGSRSWGAGNIKNARGAGDRGGVGRGGRKHKMSYYWVYDRESTHTERGFVPYQRKRLSEIDLDEISKRAAAAGGIKPVFELKGYKVLGDGRMLVPVVVKASGFTKSAQRKIAEAGGEAVKL